MKTYVNTHLQQGISNYIKWSFQRSDTASGISKYLYRRLGKKAISVHIDKAHSQWFFYSEKSKKFLFRKYQFTLINQSLIFQNIELELNNYLTHTRFT